MIITISDAIAIIVATAVSTGCSVVTTCGKNELLKSTNRFEDPNRPYLDYRNLQLHRLRRPLPASCSSRTGDPGCRTRCRGNRGRRLQLEPVPRGSHASRTDRLRRLRWGKRVGCRSSPASTSGSNGRRTGSCSDRRICGINGVVSMTTETHFKSYSPHHHAHVARPHAAVVPIATTPRAHPIVVVSTLGPVVPVTVIVDGPPPGVIPVHAQRPPVRPHVPIGVPGTGSTSTAAATTPLLPVPVPAIFVPGAPVKTAQRRSRDQLRGGAGRRRRGAPG